MPELIGAPLQIVAYHSATFFFKTNTRQKNMRHAGFIKHFPTLPEYFYKTSLPYKLKEDI